MVYKGETLKSALETLRKDYLFWQREVYERIYHNKGGGKGKLSKSKGQGYRAPYWSPESWKQIQDQKQWTGQQSGKGKGKGKKGAKDGGKAPKDWPQGWATQNPRGVQVCGDFHIRKNCKGNCGRSHNCPVTKDGWTCNTGGGRTVGPPAKARRLEGRQTVPQPTVAHRGGEPIGSVPSGRVLPDRLLERLSWTPSQTPLPGKDLIVMLYVGKDDASALDSVLHSIRPDLTDKVIVVELLNMGPAC